MTANPVRGVDYPSTYQQLLEWFPDNQSLPGLPGRTALARRVRVPEVRSHRFWRTGAGLWMCRACGRRTSVTAGTIFDRTRTPLSTWFAAIWFLTSQKNGMSALGPATGPRVRLLRDGVGLDAQAAPGDGPPGAGQAVRDRGARRDDDRRRHPGRLGGYDKVAVMIAIEHNETRRLGRVRLAVADPARNDRPGRLRHPRHRARINDPHRRRPPCAGSPTSATPTSSPSATPPPTRPACCPACTWSPHCSSAG